MNCGRLLGLSGSSTRSNNFLDLSQPRLIRQILGGYPGRPAGPQTGSKGGILDGISWNDPGSSIKVLKDQGVVIFFSKVKSKARPIFKGHILDVGCRQGQLLGTDSCSCAFVL